MSNFARILLANPDASRSVLLVPVLLSLLIFAGIQPANATAGTHSNAAASFLPEDSSTETATATPTNTPTPTATSTPTTAAAETPTSTTTPPRTPTATATETPTRTATPSRTPTKTPPHTPTSTSTITPGSTPTPTATQVTVDTPWSAAALISDPLKNAWKISMALAPDSSACIMFVQSTNFQGYEEPTLYARCRAATGAWGPFEVVSAAPTGAQFWTVDIALDDAGNAYAVWSDNGSDPVNHTPDVFFAARSGAGVWTAPRQINIEAQGPAAAIHVATDPAGNAHVVWTAYQLEANQDGLTYHTQRAPDGAWSPPELVSHTAGRVANAITVDGAANVHVILATYDYFLRKLILYYTTRPPTGPWATETVIPDAHGADITLAADGANRLYASYTDYWTDDPFRVKLIARSIEGHWSAPEAFGAPVAPGSPPYAAIAVDVAGNVHAVWGPSRDGPQGTYLNFRLRPFGDSWQPAETVWTPAIYGDDVHPQIALDNAGKVYAAWAANVCGPGDCVGRVYFASRPALLMPIRCQTQATLSFTQYYGLVTLSDGRPAPAGTVIRAFNPRGEEVGCTTTTAAERYGYLRVYGEDTSVNPPIPGLRPAEPVTFKVNRDDASASPAPVMWQDDKLPHQVHLGQAYSQEYTWLPGWNLFSIAVRPPDTQPGAVLSAATGQYDMALGQSGAYAPPPADPAYNTLAQLTYGKAYWIRATATSMLAPGISGFTVAVTTPLTLGASWQWIGYLPHTTLPVTTALASIAGKYDRLIGFAGTYEPPPADPRFNTIADMAPGQGYLIHLTSAATLIYPADSHILAHPAHTPARANAGCSGVAITPYFTEYFGALRLNGADAPIGTLIKAHSPRGDLVGCTASTHSGVYGYLRIYGEDPTATPPIPGMRPGEAVSFSINGKPPTTIVGSPIWSDDKAHHQLDLTFIKVPLPAIYLPLLLRGG